MGEGTDPEVMVGPGKQLQQAREALNLTPQEMAARLHLHVKVVNAIESEHYNELPLAYVRGYIRAYARLLGLDPEPLIADYNKIARETPAIQPWTSKPARPARSHDKPVKAVTYLVIAILGVLLAIWWQNREAGWPELPLSSETNPEHLPESPNPALGPSSPNEMVPPPEPLPPTQASPGGGVDTSIPSEVTTPTPIPPQQKEVPSDTTMGPPPAVALPNGPLEGSKSRSLVLELAKDSWAEITDAKGEPLYRKLAKGGQTISLQLQGEPPFRIVIGNAPAVNVLYNGKPVDISSFSRGGVARFEVGDDGLHL